MKTVSAPFIMLVFYSLITKCLNYWLVIQALSHCVDRAYFTDWQVCLVKGMVFPVVVYGCKSWTMKKAESWRIDAFELWCWRRLESHLDYVEIQPVHPKGCQFWIFIGRTDAEAETPILWSPDAKNGLIRKDPDAGKDWGQEEKGTIDDEMV